MPRIPRSPVQSTCKTILLAGCVALWPQLLRAAVPVDTYDARTLLLHHFESSLDASRAAGSSRAAGHSALVPNGKIGRAVRLERGMATGPNGLILPFAPLQFDTNGNFDARRGTLEFWIKPQFKPLSERDFGTNYYVMDSWQGHGFRLILQDNLKGRRQWLWSEKAAGAEKDWSFNSTPVNWQPDEWHSVAVVWDGNHRAFFIDGQEAGTGESINSTLPLAPTMWLGSSVYSTWLAQSDMDELRVSDVARNGTRGTEPLPAPASTFNEENGASNFNGGAVKWRNETSAIQNGVAGNVQATFQNQKRGVLTEHAVTFRNTGNAPQFVRAWVEMPYRGKNNSHFWDGRSARRIATSEARPLEQSEILNTFPLACAYDSGDFNTAKYGVAAGLHAGELRSWFGSNLREGKLYFQTKIALAPGESDTVRFVSFSFAPEYDYFGAVQTYQDAFAQWTRPQPGIDPRILSGCLTGGGWYVAPSLDNVGAPVFSPAEIARRARTQWEWSYAPFKYAGDWRVREAWWPRIPEPQKATVEHRAPTSEPFVKKRAERFAALEKWNIAPAFYYINWVNEVLEPEYRDALIKIEDVSDGRGVKISPWVQSYSTDLRAFWWGTDLETNTKSDLKVLAENLPLTAFAHDVAVGGSKYRGAGLWKTPGRAYDQRGAYVEEGVGIALMMDYIHTLRANGFRVANTANNAPCTAAIAFRVDNAIYEGRADEALVREADSERTRLLHGAKPRSLYTHNYSLKYGSRFDASQFTDEQLRNIARRMWDYALLFALRDGYTLGPDMTFGYERSARLAPMADELARAGWQPVSAMKVLAGKNANSTQWLSRYGSGDNTKLVLLNPREESVTTTIRIDQKYLHATQNYLFANVDAAPLSQSLNGAASTFTVALPARGALILQAVAALPRNVNWKGAVSQQWDAARGSINIEKAPRNIRYIARKYFEAEKTGAPQFRSTWLQSAEKDFLEFPWRDASIVLPANANDEQRWAAWRVQEYFRFYDAAVNKNKQPLLLPIVEAAENGKPQILVQRGEKWSVSRNGLVMTFSAPDAQWRLFLDVAFASLDRKFPFTGDWTVYMSHINAATANKDVPTAEVLKRAGFPGAPIKEN